MPSSSFLALPSLLAISSPAGLKNLLPSLLQRCSSSKDLESLHSAIMKNNFHQDSFVINQFLAACSRLNQIDRALLAFNRMIDPNFFVCNAMIGCLINCSAAADALHLFVELPKSNHPPTCHTFSQLIRACTQIPAAGFGKAVHGQIRRSGFICHLVLQTGLIHFYSMLHQIEDSRKVFDEMSVRDAFSWNTMIFGYTQAGDMDAASKLFDEMPGRNAVSWNAMIAGYARSGDAGSSASLFEQMPDKNLISWTTVICCYSHNRLFREALETFDAMRDAGVSPDKVTMCSVISACAHLGALEPGRRMRRLIALYDFSMDVYIGSALVDMYAKCGCIERSLVLFFKLEEKNLYCWNSIIDGLAMHGRSAHALYMLSKMIECSSSRPNSVTFISILRACNHAGLVEEGRSMFSSMMEDSSIAPEMEHYSCMVDLLARAGHVHEALDFVRKMRIVPSSVVWGALLSGCKIHGDMEVAKIAMERLEDLDPRESSRYMVLVEMYARENRWAEVGDARKKMKELGVHKPSPGGSWIEINGVVHEFAASDASPFSSDCIFLFVSELHGHMQQQQLQRLDFELLLFDERGDFFAN
ncbi:Pentatricopeptide repeat-containing protein [Platanthera zijinensis]|uniref:Pentatricopeptide repeat-containing protein n=1 Tax=Platanthera zijinensis TaxID=2320716 RepID=A0AAP0G9A4_9ASPA